MKMMMMMKKMTGGGTMMDLSDQRLIMTMLRF